MITPQQFAALNPLGLDFDRFLYARVGNDQQGELLSVVSALARLGVDPWDEAALLARLPVDSAARTLSALLAQLPAGSGKPIDNIFLATHLISLLPHRPRRPVRPTIAAATLSRTATGTSYRLMALLYVGFLLLLMGTQLLMQNQPVAPTTPAVTPAPQATGAISPR